MEGAASLPHRSEAGELTLARRRCSSGSPLYAAATCRSLPDDCQGRRSLRGGEGGGGTGAGQQQQQSQQRRQEEEAEEEDVVLNPRARIPPPQRDCGGWDALMRARAARVPAPPTLPRLHPEEDVLLRTPPPTQPPLKGGTTCWRRPPGSRLMHGCDAMLCNAVLLCYAMRSRAVLCYAML